MSETYYNPLSDMGGIKESLISLFQSTEDITRLVSQFFGTSYVEGVISDNGCAVFIETRLSKVMNQRFKEVGIDVYVVCHKDSIALSEEDKTYYSSLGVYGNRVDSIVQMLHSTLVNSETMNEKKLSLTEEEPIKQYMQGTDFYGKQISYTYQSFYQRTR